MAAKEPERQPSRPLFEKLKPGPRSIPAEQVAEHQRERLERAMIELVAREGYPATTVNDLVTEAHVSKTTFYELFEDKEDCFLATFDEVVRQVAMQVGEAYRRPGDFRQKLVAALACFMDLAVKEQAAARLTTIESLTLGTAGVGHRERGAAAFELMIRRSFDHSPSRVEVSDVVVRGIVAGIRGVVYRVLRADEAEALPAMVEPLVDWALSYQRHPSAAIGKAMRTATRPPRRSTAEALEETGIPWEESPASDRSRAELSQRERIVRGAAQVAVEIGYGGLSIPTISAASGTSNQTFYKLFSNKRDAFLSAFEEIAAEVLQVAGEAFRAEGDRPEAVGAAVRALLEFFATRELFAQLAFFGLPTAGPVALDRADQILDEFTVFLQPGLAPSAFGAPLEPEILPAIASAVWAAIQHEIAHGRRSSLPELGPEIVLIAVGPFNRR
ncbi:MAG TPA: TetR/AcrR family transcriptional regulator [Solirubrobacterales bacterium]|nr:TetR/AcrR family transcriptional regulator [Solirubrobacterales bacterium]